LSLLERKKVRHRLKEEEKSWSGEKEWVKGKGLLAFKLHGGKNAKKGERPVVGYTSRGANSCRDLKAKFGKTGRCVTGYWNVLACDSKKKRCKCRRDGSKTVAIYCKESAELLGASYRENSEDPHKKLREGGNENRGVCGTNSFSRKKGSIKKNNYLEEEGKGGAKIKELRINSGSEVPKTIGALLLPRKKTHPQQVSLTFRRGRNRKSPRGSAGYIST